jgi:hypothetical protein
MKKSVSAAALMLNAMAAHRGAAMIDGQGWRRPTMNFADTCITIFSLHI